MNVPVSRVLLATLMIATTAAPEPTFAQSMLAGKQADPQPQDEVREGPWEDYSPDAWWIVYVKPGSLETYAIRNKDFGTGNVFFGLGGQGVRIWVKGNHKSNPAVAYRKTMTLYRFLCQSKVYAKDQFIASTSNGRIIQSWQRGGKFQAWVPDSLEEAVADHVCRSGTDR